MALAACGPAEAGPGDAPAETELDADATALAKSAPAGRSAGTESSAAGTRGFEPVIGCPAARWPSAGIYVEAPGPSSAGAAPSLAGFSALGISADGRVVVGSITDAATNRARPARWTEAHGVETLAAPGGGEGLALQSSCDGSVVLEQAVPSGDVYRASEGRSERVLGHSPPRALLSMSPDGALIVNGQGVVSERAHTPERWSLDGGAEPITALENQAVYGVSPRGGLIGVERESLFELDASNNVKTPLGTTPLELAPFSDALVISANGRAWLQSSDDRLSVLLGGAGSEPLALSCPSRCWAIDVSASGRAALLDVALDDGATRFASSLWTAGAGLVDLGELLERSGFPLHGRKARAVALSDDARALTGYSFDAGSERDDARFFYAVLPAALYE